MTIGKKPCSALCAARAALFVRKRMTHLGRKAGVLTQPRSPTLRRGRAFAQTSAGLKRLSRRTTERGLATFTPLGPEWITWRLFVTARCISVDGRGPASVNLLLAHSAETGSMRGTRGIGFHPLLK
ncbi:hypothetical protein AAFF_G00305990 [Aldrovandia affinis]|uniref:Uncharacterized protein n=1 Tax=Aldrovandia affinis TaxID=143900 RepID=A0AAD7SQF4_9TELE|nr:hypothetical protein AAFF_G00305990 [Aldrovandia affinis]